MPPSRDVLTQFRTLARNWAAFGDVDPMFGILSDPTKQGGNWPVEEFFETGRAHVQKLLRILDCLGVAFPRGDCLDFGCGVGRLTIPLASSFERTVGVDIARSMIGPARRYVPPHVRCTFMVNKHPDLRMFSAGQFDFVHSCLVLQHNPPEIAVRYIGEFLRVCRAGGLVVFQLPAETRSQAFISAMHALSESGYCAEVAILDPPAILEASEPAVLRLRVVNRSPVEWRHDIPAGRHICIGNHWLHDDGSSAVRDDGRTRLPVTLRPGESVDVDLGVKAPETPGRYLIEVDLVQECVSWFAERGSPSARSALVVNPSTVAPPPPAPIASPPRPSLTHRIRRWIRGGTPTFDMHVVPRASVEDTIRAHGGELLHAIDDDAAGERWLSYTYICRRVNV